MIKISKEDTIADGSGQEADSSVETKREPKDAFSGIRRQLNNKDLKNPAVGRLLLEERGRLRDENVRLAEYIEMYHRADKKAATLDEKVRSGGKFDILYTFATAVGGVLMGTAFTVGEAGGFAIQIGLLVLGAVLIAVSAVIKHLIR